MRREECVVGNHAESSTGGIGGSVYLIWWWNLKRLVLLKDGFCELNKKKDSVMSVMTTSINILEKEDIGDVENPWKVCIRKCFCPNKVTGYCKSAKQ